MWKAIVFVALGLIAGYTLSGIPARREVAALREEREALRTQLAEASRPNLLEAFLPGLSGASPRGEGSARANARAPRAAELESPGRRDSESGRVDPLPGPRGDVVVIGADRDQRPERTAPATPGALPDENTPPGSSEEASPPRDGKTDRERFAERSARFLERFDELVAAQRVRTAAARSALVSQAGLNEEEVQRFDGTVERMNQKLEGYGQEMIDQAASEEPPTPSQALGLGHDVSGILHEGQQELDTLVGDKGKAVDASALQIWNYVDVEQWRPYIEQQREAQGGKVDAPGQKATGQGTGGRATGAAGGGAPPP